MNSPVELAERLLKLYPVKIVKAQFDADGTQAEILPEIAARHSPDAIRDFALGKIGLTKQHSRIFTLDSPFNRGTFDPSALPMPVVSEFHQEVNGKMNYVFYCLPLVEYDVALLKPYEEFTVQFYQPTRVVVRHKTLVIQTTIMERSAAAYISRDKERRLVDLQKRNTEDVFIPQILDVFKQQYTVEVCDLNKGVKAIWEGNSIDCTSVRYRKDKSTTTESMDEQYTVKAHMPDTYQEIITRPLDKMAFRPLEEGNSFSRSFMVDPSKGILSMAIYPDDSEQTWNVINEILRHNQ